ncbi:MAG: hypothetical protein AB1297_02635, partial [bacterium]
MVYTVYLKNNTDNPLENRTIVVSNKGGAYWRFYGSITNVNIPAKSQGSFAFKTRLNYSTFMYFGLLREPFGNMYDTIAWKDAIIIYCEKGVWLKEARVDVGIRTNKSLYGQGDKVNISVFLKNKQAIGYDANLILKIIDPKNNPIFSTETTIVLDPNEEETLNFGFVLPKTYGYYTIQAEVIRENQRIGYSMAYFEIPKVFLSLTPILPKHFTEGTNTILFIIENKGKVSSSATLSLEVSDQESLISNQEISIPELEPKKTKTIKLDFYISSLKLRTYSLNYTLAYENEIIKGKDEIPCSIIINPKFDKASYRIRENMKLEIGLINNGRFLLKDLDVLVSIPDCSFQETRTITLKPKERASFTFNLGIPEETSAGIHCLEIKGKLSKDGIEKKSSFSIPPSKLEISLDKLDYLIGEEGAILVKNTGGVDEGLDYKIKVEDLRYRDSYYENSGYIEIKVGSSATINFLIKDQLLDGRYLVILKKFEENIFERNINVAGIKASLSAKTEKQAYLVNEPIKSRVEINNMGKRIKDGTLSIKVVSAYPSWTNFSSEDIGVEEFIQTMAVSEDSVWFGGGGQIQIPWISRYDKANDEWHWAIIRDENIRTKQFFTEWYVSAIAIDGNDVWIGDNFGWLWRYTKKAGGWERVETVVDFLDQYDCLRKIAVDGNYLWVGSNRKLYRYNKITQEVEKFPDILASPIAVDKDYVWFATYNGAYRYDKANDTFKHYGEEIGSASVYAAAVDKDSIWFGTDKGAYRYDKANDTFERFGEEVGLVNIYAVAADENSVWFGGANGAYRYDKINKSFRHYTPENSRLRISDIAEIGIDAESVWFRDCYSAARYYKYSENGNNILFKQEIPINIEKGETNEQEIEIGTLSAKGKLYLEASLSSSLSQNIALPVIHPFYIFPSAIELFLAPDKKIYWPGELITIFGTVSNKGTVSEELNLNLMCNNEPLFTASFTLSPQASYLFVATKTADSSFMLKGEVNEVKISERIIVEQPSLDVSIISSEVVGRGTNSLSILFKNKGKRRIDLDFSLNLQGLITKGSISIEEEESKIIEQWFSILDDGTITLVLSGDVVGTYTKPIEFGEKVELSLNPEPIYPYPFVELPFTLENKGKMDSEFEVCFKLEKESKKGMENKDWCKDAKIKIKQNSKLKGQNYKSKVKIQGDSVLLIQPFFMQAGGKIEGTLVYELSTGTYKVSYDYFRGTGTRQFKVAKNNLARIEDMVLGKENKRIKVDVFVSNQGGNDFMGNLALSSSFFKQEKAIEIKKADKGTYTFLLEPNVSKGTYTIMGEVLYNGEGISKREEIFSLTPDFRLKELAYPALIVGEIATLTFTIENIGFVEDGCDFSFALLDLIDFKDSLFLSSDCEKTIMIPFSIPDDFEDGTFTGELRINEKKIEIPLNIRGIKIELLAYLDKVLYKLDDDATLTLRITNLSKMGSLSMFAKVRLNGYEEERAFSLYGSNTLTFTFKVTGFNEKLFYGMYSKDGRAIYLNSLYLNQENDVISLWTDQDVYKMGETMTIYAKTNIPGTLTINGLDYSREEYITQTFTDTFVLPKNLFSGTYYLYYSLGTYTFEKPFDVYGKEARVIKEELDRKVYKKKDTMELGLIFLSNFSEALMIKGWIEDPKGNYREVFSENLLFQEGRNAFNVKAPFQTPYSGMHKLVYGIYLKESGV